MVNIIVSLGRNGTQDWFLQRVSAVILALYSIFIFVFMVTHPHLNFDAWYDFFQIIWVKLATFFTILSLVIHSWVGMVTIITDYIKPIIIRVFAHMFVILSLIVSLVWGIVILWSI